MALVPGCTRPANRPVVIGAKKFTESIILAEMGVQLARAAGADARRDDLGGTPALWLALTQGDIDVYPEYTGTITREILKADPPDLAAAAAAHGVRISRPLGFRNNYALGMRKDVAAAKGITKISDLRGHPDLRLGFNHEFLDRPDGWPGVKRHYDLPQANAQGMNHTLAYRALVEKAIDVTEVYTTDGEIAQYDLLVLKDDRNFFPAYEAVWLYRARPRRPPPGRGRAAPPAGGPHHRAGDAADERRGAGRQARGGGGCGRVPALRAGRRFPHVERYACRPGAGDDRRTPVAGHPVAAGGRAGRRPARGARRPPAAAGPGHPRGCRRAPDDPLAGAAAVHDPGDDVARGQGDRSAARDRGVVPLQPAARRPKHARRADGHSRLAARGQRRQQGCRRSRRCGGSSCRWPPRRSWPGYGRPPSSTSGRRHSAGSSGPAGTAARSSAGSTSSTCRSCWRGRFRRRSWPWQSRVYSG